MTSEALGRAVLKHGAQTLYEQGRAAHAGSGPQPVRCGTDIGNGVSLFEKPGAKLISSAQVVSEWFHWRTLRNAET